MDSHPERVPSDSEEKPPRMAAKTNEGGSEEASRRLASGEKGKNRAVRRKSARLLEGIQTTPNSSPNKKGRRFLKKRRPGEGLILDIRGWPELWPRGCSNLLHYLLRF